MKEIPRKLPTIIYQQLTPTVNPKISKSRIRTFYKYENRNGSYFSDKVSDELIASAAWTPVIGKYNVLKEDFEGHSKPLEVKMYGAIPPETGFAWEKHRDNDGIVREYACFDVVLWTEYFDEAKKIVGKAQSMELDREATSGNWELRGDTEYYIYDSTRFKGLCILGDDVVPCFEGAGFYEKDPSMFQFMFEMFDVIKQNEETKKQNINISNLHNAPDGIADIPIQPFQLNYDQLGNLTMNGSTTGQYVQYIPIKTTTTIPVHLLNQNTNIPSYTQGGIININEEGGERPMPIVINGLKREDYNLLWNHFNPDFNENGKFSVIEIPIAADDKTVTTFAMDTGTIRKYSIVDVKDGVAISPAHYELNEKCAACFDNAHNDLATKFQDSQNMVVQLQAQLDSLAAAVAADPIELEPEPPEEGWEQKIQNVELSYQEEIKDLKEDIEELQAQLETYLLQDIETQIERKKGLIESFREVLEEDDIKPIEEASADYSYDELEQKLSVLFSQKTLRPRVKEQRIPLADNLGPKSKLETLLEQYALRKNSKEVN